MIMLRQLLWRLMNSNLVLAPGATLAFGFSVMLASILLAVTMSEPLCYFGVVAGMAFCLKVSPNLTFDRFEALRQTHPAILIGHKNFSGVFSH